MKTLINKLRTLLKTILLFSFIFPVSGISNGIVYDVDPVKVCKEEVSEKDKDNKVVFSSFFIIKKENKALILWSTSFEYQNKGFTIERSSDLEEWTGIGLIEGQKKSFDYIDYKFLDEYPENGTNYYRVKQNENNGKNAMTKIKSLKFKVDIINSYSPIYAVH